jgi:hypothetical protein
LIFTWTSGGNFLQSFPTTKKSHSIKYKINAQSEEDVFEVTCFVSNGIIFENADQSKSKTVFKIIHKNKVANKFVKKNKLH